MKEPLIETICWQCNTSPHTYPNITPLAKKHLGEISMPLPFNQIDRSEKLNEVQVNIFRFRKKDLLPFESQNFDVILQ